jgi:hypothetical protein
MFTAPPARRSSAFTAAHCAEIDKVGLIYALIT